MRVRTCNFHFLPPILHIFGSEVVGVEISKHKGRIICGAAGAAVGALIYVYSVPVREGVKRGLLLCTDTVIPSLFLFTAAVMFISLSGAAEMLGKVLNRLSMPLFGLSGEQAVVMLLSFFSGYPVGARLINELYIKGAVDKLTANKMLFFCVNAGPAFVVTAVGEAMLGSRSDGIRLLTAHLCASVITAAGLKFIKHKPPKEVGAVPCDKNRSAAESFVGAVSAAADVMFSVCSFVVLFSGISGLINTVLGGRIADTVCGLLEVTVGVSRCTRAQLPFVSFMLGFSGVSVMFQVMSAAKDIKPCFALIVLGRLLHGTVSAAIVFLLNEVFPRTVFVSAGAPRAAVHGSPAAAAALMILCAVLLSSLPTKK